MSGVLTTDTVLDKIVERKKLEVEKLKSQPRLAASEHRHSENPGRDFIEALADKSRKGRAVIAEIKRASPSAGIIRDPFHPKDIARAYEANGARCISVLTDEEFFQGSIGVLREVRAVTSLPLLRKDFIIHPVQIEDAARAGADAILLIARILGDELFQRLYERANQLKLAALIEVHDEDDLARTRKLDPAPQLIGVNNRDLADFSVSIDTTIKLLPAMPKGATVISESGLSDTAVLNKLSDAGVNGFLIGTAFMKAKDVGRELRRLVHE